MTNFLRSLALGSLAAVALSGCAAVNSSMPSTSSVTGEAWYTEGTGFFGLFWGSRVYYCPAVTGSGPAQCKEAKLVEAPKTK